MARIDCPHEADVLAMVTTGRWPGRMPADLRDHLATCDVCADLATVAAAIDEVREATVPARLPSAGTVWWRAQLRARQDAAKDVGRPITVAQAALLAATGGVAGAVFGATTDWFQQVIHRLWGLAASAAASVHVPSPPAWSVDPSATLASHGLGLGIVVLGLAAALGVVAWALREE